jgi:hypothetical protein
MDPDVLAAIRAEIQADPMGRGYALHSSADNVADLLNEAFDVPAPAAFQDVPVSSVEGYMRLRRHIVRLRRWVAAAEPSDLRDFAEELLEMIAAGSVKNFETSNPGKRAAILGAFEGLAQAGAGGFSAQSLADLAAMTVAPPGPPTRHHPRWVAVMLALPPELATGLPNEVTTDMVAEALA